MSGYEEYQEGLKILSAQCGSAKIRKENREKIEKYVESLRKMKIELTSKPIRQTLEEQEERDHLEKCGVFGWGSRD